MKVPGLLFVLIALALTGCGRDSLQGRCGADDECRAGRLCISGQCVDPGDVDAGPDATNNGSNNGSNNQNNCTERGCECSAAEDCAAGLLCIEGTCADPQTDCYVGDDQQCRYDVCSGDVCSSELCDVGCPPDRVQYECECVPSCTTDGSCVCESDADCLEGEVCGADGVCEKVEGCRTDQDCAPDERCAPDDVCRPRPQCLLDADCPRADQICFNGRCTLSPDCQVDLDCPMGMECVAGNCFLAVCRGPDDCESDEICDAGECVEPPAVTECFTATPNQLIAQSQQIPLEAFALDQNGAGLAARFTWTSSNNGIASVQPGPIAVGGAVSGVATLTAVLADQPSVACSGAVELTNPGPVQPNMVRVAVREATTGSPVSNARVRIGNAIEPTNAAGIAFLADPGTATYEVSVFSGNHDWITLQGVAARDIRVPLRRQSGSGPVAGFTGEFDTSQLHSAGNITIGLGGASLAGGLLNPDLSRLLGDPFVRSVDIIGDDIPVPGGVVIYGGAFGFMVDVKREYYAQSAGGPRIAWGLAGNVPLADLIDLFQGGGGGFDGQDILTMILPLFNRFDHSATPAILNELPRVVDLSDIDGDGDTTEELPDYLGFPEIDMTPSVRQNLTSEVDISNFPVLRDGTTGVAVLVGGVVLPSPGLVPTGISATSDADGDGRPDGRRLSIAPAYGSITGGRYAILALTFGGSGGLGQGGFEFPDEFSVALWNGQSFPASIRLGTFPDASQTTVDAASRMVSVSASAGPMFRVRVVGNNRSWDVWSVGPAGVLGQFAHQVTIPSPPAMGGDIFANGAVLVDAIQTNVTLDDLVSGAGVGLDNAGLLSTAFNRTAAR